jgi:CheY-like chemotaxis protein
MTNPYEDVKVVIADDDQGARDTIFAILTSPGMKIGIPKRNIRTAKHGEEALTLIRAEMPDLLITDVSMPSGEISPHGVPGISGIEVIYQTRTEPEGNKPKIILVTTHLDADTITAAKKAGADDWLNKSALADDLASKVAESFPQRPVLAEPHRNGPV